MQNRSTELISTPTRLFGYTNDRMYKGTKAKPNKTKQNKPIQTTRHTAYECKNAHSQSQQQQQRQHNPKLLKTGKFNLQMIVLKWIFASSCCCSSHVQVHIVQTPNNNHRQVYVEHDMPLQFENAHCITVV